MISRVATGSDGTIGIVGMGRYSQARQVLACRLDALSSDTGRSVGMIGQGASRVAMVCRGGAAGDDRHRPESGRRWGRMGRAKP